MRSIKDLSAETIQKYSDTILRIASDVPEEYWQLEHLLLPLEGKWKLSFCVMVNGVPKAYVIASNRKGNYHIHHFMVTKELRGAGIGSMMLSEAEKRAKTNGLHTMTLKILKSNTKARAFYLKHGFEIFERNVGESGKYFALRKIIE